MKKTIPLILAMCFLLTGCSYFSFLGLGQSPETKAGIKMLEGMLRQGDSKDLNALGRDMGPAAKIALDLGEPAIPALEKALYDPKENIRNFASEALFLIGGEKARDTLKQAHDKTKNEFILMHQCLTMASTGSPEDVYFLMKTLEAGSDKGNKAAASAFLSLVVLKPDKMIKDINLNSGPGARIDPKWKELFLLSMDLGSREPPQMSTAGPEDKIIFTLFKFGIPGTDQSPVFLETGKERTWKLENKVWSFFQDDNREIYHSREISDIYNPPYIEFEIHTDKTGTRALVNVGVIFGKTAGSGYSFILKMIKGEWKVVGMALTWIS
ncbi:MAG: HEAT repeat domain-containing protein [Desulfobacula sp.]